MLRDLAELVLNPYPWHLAPMGYLRETRLIAHHARRLEHAWHPHLNATRQLVTESVDLCTARKTVVVVGSGTLLDVPLDSLSTGFEQVILLDIFHSQATRRAVRPYSNVTLMACDVSGLVHQVYRAARRRDVDPLPRSKPPTLAGAPVDLIVSLNVVSQLALIPTSFLKGHCPGIPAVQLSAFSRDLIDAHLAWLTQSARQVCLVTDVRRIETPLAGPATTKDILEGRPLPPPDGEWLWHIAPIGRIYRQRSAVHHVQGFRAFQITDPPARPLTETHR